MIFYAYKTDGGGIALFTHKAQLIIPRDNDLYRYFGEVDLDIKPEKKVVQKKMEFENYWDLAEKMSIIARGKNIVVYYDTEE